MNNLILNVLSWNAKKHVSLLLVVSMMLMPSWATAGNNVAISEFVNEIRGSFNMIVADENVVSPKSIRKTRAMIKKGYHAEIVNMQILLDDNKLQAHIRGFSPKYYPQFSEQEKDSDATLNSIVNSITQESKKRLSKSALFQKAESHEGEALASAASEVEDGLDEEDIGMDIDFDDTLDEITEDEIEYNNDIVSLDEMAKSAFVDIARAYALSPLLRGQQARWYAGGNEESITLGSGVVNLKHLFIPYQQQGLLQPLPLHAVFATSFLPDRQGVLHVMEMYIILMVNEAEHGTVRVAQRKIDRFRWDRNPFYISAATGTVLKKIFSRTLGEKVESF